MLRRLTRMLCERRAVAAVEFAFVAPVLLLLFFATVELTDALDCRSRVNNAVAAAADLTAQATAVSRADLANVVAAVGAILYPNKAAAAGIVISSVIDNNTGNGKVAWSYATANATTRSVGSTVALPSGLITAGSGQSVILAEIVYAYAPPTTEFLTGTVSMRGIFYSRPRRSTAVTCSDC